MTREDIADRLVNYADAAAAFSIVSSLALLGTLTQTDVRSSIASFKWIAICGYLSTSLAISIFVVVLHKAETKIRAAGSSVPADVERLLRWFFIARLGGIGVSTLLTAAALSRLSNP